jgi:hypothetical protein
MRAKPWCSASKRAATKPPPRSSTRTAAVVGVGAALAGAQALLRGDSNLKSWSAVQEAIHRAGPTMLFIYSDT